VKARPTISYKYIESPIVKKYTHYHKSYNLLQFCHTATPSHRHGPHRVATDRALFEETWLDNSIAMLKIRDDFSELIDLQLILLIHSASFVLHRRLEDADSVAVDICLVSARLSERAGNHAPSRALTFAPASIRLLTESGRARIAA